MITIFNEAAYCVCVYSVYTSTYYSAYKLLSHIFNFTNIMKSVIATSIAYKQWWMVQFRKTIFIKYLIYECVMNYFINTNKLAIISIKIIITIKFDNEFSNELEAIINKPGKPTAKRCILEF